MNRLDLSPCTDTATHQLLSDSEAILSRELYRALRSQGHTAAESLRIVHRHNEYDYQPPRAQLSRGFTKRPR